MKALRNGDFLCSDFTNWDIIRYDSSFTELERLEGNSKLLPCKRNITVAVYKNIRTRVTDDDAGFVWLRSPTEISLVNIGDFSVKHIHNFWNFRGKDAKAVAVAVDSICKKVVGVGFSEGPASTYTIHVFDGTDGVTIFEANEVMPGIEQWSALEVSTENDVFFLSASQNQSRIGASSYLFALAFDEDAETINMARYGTAEGVSGIECMKRHPDGNVLFIGSTGVICIILWADKQFHFISKVSVSAGVPITDITFFDNILYCVFGTEEGTAIYFDPSYENMRDNSRKEQFRQMLPHIEPVYQENESPSKRGPLADMYRSKARIEPQYAGVFSKHKVRQISMPGAELLRVQVTSDGTGSRIYCGKDQLKILQESAGTYRLLDAGSNISPFYDIKLLENGDLIVYERETSNLIKYDGNLIERMRLDGHKKILTGKLSVL